VGARGSYGKTPVVDLSSSSDKGDLIADVSRDEEFTRRLFADLNRNVLGSPGNDKIIILNDSDEKGGGCERRRPPMLKLRHLLLQGPRPQPPPSMMPMAPTRVIPLIG
jgi:hypothetical protein